MALIHVSYRSPSSRALQAVLDIVAIPDYQIKKLLHMYANTPEQATEFVLYA